MFNIIPSSQKSTVSIFIHMIELMSEAIPPTLSADKCWEGGGVTGASGWLNQSD